MTSSLYSLFYDSPRLLPNQGYSDDPGFIPRLSIRLPHPIHRIFSRDLVFGPNRYELWSLNCQRIPVYPGALLPSLHIEQIPSIVPRFDGGLGPLDPTMGPQLFDPSCPWLACVERYAPRSSPALPRPEHRSLTSLSDIWEFRDQTKGLVSVNDSVVKELLARTVQLDGEMLQAAEDVAIEDPVLAQTLWDGRPDWPTEDQVASLSSSLLFADSLDLMKFCQRGLRLRQGWLNYALERVGYTFPSFSSFMDERIPDASDNRMGFFVTDEASPFLRILLFGPEPSPCFVMHQYTPDEQPCHHSSAIELCSDMHDDLPSSFQEDNVFFRMAQEVPQLIVEQVDAYACIRKPALPSQPYAGARSLSNRQDLRSPSPVTPALRPKRSRTAPYLPPHIPIPSNRLLSLLPRAPAQVPALFESEALLLGERLPSDPLLSESNSIEDSPMSCVVETGTQRGAADADLYNPYSGVYSRYWRIESLPSRIDSPKSLFDFLSSSERQITVPTQDLLVLRNWTMENAGVYWVRFGSAETAVKVRGLLTGDARATEGFSGSLVPEEVFQRATKSVTKQAEEYQDFWHKKCVGFLKSLERQTKETIASNPQASTSSRQMNPSDLRTPQLARRLNLTLQDRLDFD
ncbi:hypothetical protein ONZ45_g12912 [Pleurotus djamor]|nr:hypothetical protein ONZ45_g12912 [Pleurotus djamor]